MRLSSPLAERSRFYSSAQPAVRAHHFCAKENRRLIATPLASAAFESIDLSDGPAGQ